MKTRFKKPTSAEVEAYAAEIGFKIDGKAFCDRYEAVGWVYGNARTPIKDWKAVVRTWKRNSAAWNHGQPVKPGVDLRDKYLAEAASLTISLQQRIRHNLQTPSGGDPKDELSRLWKGLRDKHGAPFIEDLKARLKSNV